MDVFFYGLFMDQTILLNNDIEPRNLRKGYLKDFALKIGNRASLIPSPGEICYGILMSCDKYALQKLYSEDSVVDYLPEEVTVFTDNDEASKAICYTLPPELISGTNATYAQSLHELAKKNGFPVAYLRHIEEMTKE